MNKSPFLDTLRQEMLALRYAKRTVDTYIYWIRLFIYFHNKRHPNTMGDDEVMQFLTHLTHRRNVSVNTQKVALNALAYLYNKHLKQPLSQELQFNKSLVARKLPIVLTPSEVKQLLLAMPPNYSLPAKLLYGSGLRLMECVRLRVQDVDFNYGVLRIWHAKGGKHRQVTLAVRTLHDSYFIPKLR